VKPGDKWRTEEQEETPSPIANLVWEKETTYVGNDRCPLIPAETCASFLTRATLKQKSSMKDATPEDYRLHELRTSGTAKGTNEIVTYISLKSGLVVRATEETQQSMDVTIAKADGTNGVHYTIEASSRFETLVVTGSDSAEKLRSRDATKRKSRPKTHPQKTRVGRPADRGRLERGAPRGFFGTNWGSDRKERRWEGGRTENTEMYGKAVQECKGIKV
jgi:hypothetical protein